MNYFSKRILLLVIIIFIILIPLSAIFFRNFSNSPSHPPPSPTQIPLQAESTEVHSPDGTMNLILHAKETKEGKNSYSLYTSTISGEKQKDLFSTLGEKGEIFVSPNAWSPDNTFVFLLKKEKETITAYVFKSSGEAFVSGEAYLDVLPFFTKKNTKYILSDITGWDSPTLLHLASSVNGKAKGPSFWFEVPSGAVLQLYN